MSLRSHARIAIRFLALFCVLFGLRANAWASGKEQVLYRFRGIPDGAIPVGGVVFDSNGNLYGATTEGGALGHTCDSVYECGTVYQLTPQGSTWNETILHTFHGHWHGDGASPFGSLIVDSANNLYGTTSYGGTGGCLLLGGPVGCGTVYEMSPPQNEGADWTYTVLYSFRGGKDGYLPTGNLVFDAKGNLYGATYYGGGYGTCDKGIYPYCGTVFELTPPKAKGGKWTEKVLYSFKSGTDGADPNGNLVFDKKGAIFGTTFFGGNQGCPQDGGVGCGTVFKLSPPVTEGHAWGYEVLHRFNNGPQSVQGDGVNPSVGVILDEKGVVYGTTISGVTAEGTLFALTPSLKRDSPWGETLVHSFGIIHDDGWGPLGLLFDAKGDLYGLTASAGKYGDGIIFRLSRQSNESKLWAYSNLYDFLGIPDGEEPSGYLTFDQNGNLYGVTQLGGTGDCEEGGCGTVFEFTP
jgi:hypothetical protein